MTVHVQLRDEMPSEPMRQPVMREVTARVQGISIQDFDLVVSGPVPLIEIAEADVDLTFFGGTFSRDIRIGLTMALSPHTSGGSRGSRGCRRRRSPRRPAGWPVASVVEFDERKALLGIAGRADPAGDFQRLPWLPGFQNAGDTRDLLWRSYGELIPKPMTRQNPGKTERGSGPGAVSA
jgi:hypothetical protein